MISRFFIQDKNKIILLMLVVAFAGALLLGIRKALPIATEVDEPIYVE